MAQLTGEFSVSILIPAYNEGGTIASVVADLKTNCPNYEVIVIDDGSSDETQERALEAGATVLVNSVNRGYGASLKRGMKHASGDIIVFFDADGQHKSSDIPILLKELEHCDMVVGQRKSSAQVKDRKLGKWALTKLAEYLLGRNIPDINSGLRAFRKADGLSYLSLYPNGFSITTTMTMAFGKDGLDIRYVPIDVEQRQGGKSTVKFFRDGGTTILLMLRVIMLFGPLRIFVPIAGALLGLGGLYTLASILFLGDIADGSLLLLLSGLNVLFVGLVADQISSINRRG